MIQEFSSLRSSPEVQRPWTGGLGKFFSSSPHLFLLLFTYSPPPPSPLSSNLPTLFLNTLHQRVSRQAVLRGRQSFYSPLPPGFVCFLKVMVHCKRTKDWNMQKKKCHMECFFVYLKISDYTGNASYLSCLVLKLVYSIGVKILPSPG